MIALKFEGQTRELGKPTNWDDERDGKCFGLPVAIKDSIAGPIFTSVWRPTPAELAALNQWHSVILQCTGLQPPVRLSVADIQGIPARDQGADAPT